MRIDLTPQAIQVLRHSDESGAELRRRIEDLNRNPRPPDALPIDDPVEMYEFFVKVGSSGVWVICQRYQDRGETVIRVTAIEQN